MSVIIGLIVENVKKLKAVRLVLDAAGGLVFLSGRNAQGKSAILDAIEMALSGAASIPGEPVRRGEESASIVLETSDGLKVTRTISADRKTRLVVKGSDGGTHGQGHLSGLISSRSMDPLAFLSLKPAEQRQELLALVGLDLSEMDANRSKVYDRRAEVNKEVVRQKVEVEQVGDVSGAPEKPVDVTAKVAELQAANLAKKGSDDLWNLVEVTDKECDVVYSDLVDHLAAVNRLEARRKELAEKLLSRGVKASAATAAVPDIESIQATLSSAAATNAAYDLKVRKDAAQEALEDAEKRSRELTAEIKQVDTEKQDMLSAAEFPVPGLSVDDSGPTLNGIPLDQASNTEQICATTAMSFEVNPELKIVLVREGSGIDDEHLAVMAKTAEEYGGQVWVEMARGAPDGSIVIEDGEVVEP